MNKLACKDSLTASYTDNYSLGSFSSQHSINLTTVTRYLYGVLLLIFKIAFNYTMFIYLELFYQFYQKLCEVEICPF